MLDAECVNIVHWMSGKDPSRRHRSLLLLWRRTAHKGRVISIFQLGISRYHRQARVPLRHIRKYQEIQSQDLW